jgi:hypothetical protein
MAAPAPPAAAVKPLIFEGDGMWQMKQDLADKTKAALRALKVYNRVMIAPMTVNPEARANAQKAVIDTQRALTESRTYWVIAGLTERELWNKTAGEEGHLAVKQLWEEWRPSPTFWQVLQEGQKLLPEHKSDETLYRDAVRQCAISYVHRHNKGPGLCNSKQPLVEGLPLGKFLITHECTDKEYVKAMHLELVPRTNIDLYVNDEGDIKGIISALTARYNKHIAKMEELQKKSLALKEGKVGAIADKIIEENPAGRSLRQVAAIFESVSKRVDKSKINRNWDDNDVPFKKLKLQQMGARPTNLRNLEKSKLHLVEDRGLEYVDAAEDGWYKFKLVSSCLKRSPPSVPFTENEGTINFFNNVLSPRLSRIIKITIQTKDGSAYEITIQPFHGMNTSVVCPFLARSEEDTNDMSNFTEREYKVYQVQPYAIQGKSGFLETIGQLLRLTQIPEVFNRLDQVSNKAENSLITGEKLFPASRVFYSASSRVAGAGSVLFICFSGQILGLLTFSPSIRYLWTDNNHPVKPPPFVAFRGRPRVGKKASKFTASIFSKKDLAEDLSRQFKIPNSITLSNLPSGSDMLTIDFKLQSTNSLIFESAPDIKPVIHLMPNKFKHTTGQVLVNWELMIKHESQPSSWEVIGYKSHQQNDPGNVLMQGGGSEWKFEKDIKGAPRTSAEKIKVGIQIKKDYGYTDSLSEIKLAVGEYVGPSTINAPTVTSTKNVMLYSDSYLSKNTAISGKIPRKIKVAGLPTKIIGDDVTELEFEIFNHDRLIYKTETVAGAYLELRPTTLTGSKIYQWGLFINSNYNYFTLALKIKNSSQSQHVLFQTEPQMWEFYHDIHGGVFLTPVMREVTFTFDKSSMYKNADVISADNVYEAPPIRAESSSQSENFEYRPSTPPFPPGSDGGYAESRAASPGYYQAYGTTLSPHSSPPSQGARSSRASSRDTSPARRIREDHAVSVVVPSSQAPAAAGSTIVGGLFTVPVRNTLGVAEGNVPNQILVNFLPLSGRNYTHQTFHLDDQNKLIYRTKNAGFQSRNYSMHMRTRTSSGVKNVEWVLFHILDAKSERPIARKISKGVSQFSEFLFESAKQDWTFNSTLDGMPNSDEGANQEKQYSILISMLKDSGFVAAKTNLTMGDLNSPAAALLPLQPRRLSSRPAPAPWASPAVDMESLMASINDIKRALNEVHLSARPRV